jgi:hypothetical protein
MKKALVLVGVLALTGSLLGQGQVNFINFKTGVLDGRVNDADGNPADNTYLAQLFAAAPGGSSFEAVGDPVAFIAQGVVSGGVVTIPASIIPTAGGAVDLQLRSWAASDGAQWADLSGVYTAGQSDTFSLGATGDGGQVPPVDLVGLTASQMQVVPEPSTWALMALGLGALALRRRK